VRSLARYSVSFFSVVAALVLTAYCGEFLAPMRLFFLWVAVLIAALIGGTVPGLIATVFAILGAVWLVFEPGTFAVGGPWDVLRLTLFAAFATGISIAVGRAQQLSVRLRAEVARHAATAVENARLYEDAQAASRAKDDFLATLSHELRTPLTAIAGWAHLLQVGVEDEATRRLAVETIVRSAETQKELIDDLLDLSRVVAGTMTLDVQPVDLLRIVHEVLVAARPAAEAKGIALTQEADGSVVVRGDERRLRQIVWNLVTNAVKFTGRGGSATVCLSANDSMACIEVTDTGKGIDPAFLPFVWDRFRQADSSTSRAHGGLGLGLAVVRHLVEMHGGTVHAESEGTGRGARFLVEIPLAGR
jgi:signal transduction histidine kinase